MTKILHISDLHFGKHYVPEVGDALQKLAQKLQVDVLAVSGDVTQRAKNTEFADALSYIDQLPAATKIVVPGNHDIPLFRVLERLRTPHALFNQHFGQSAHATYSAGGVRIIGIDSTAPPWRAVIDGDISAVQRARYQSFFADCEPADLRVIVMHHNLLPAPVFGSAKPMRRARQILDHMTDCRVDLVLSGHLHRASIGHSLDAYPGKDREHGITVVQCGTSTSRRGRGMEREKNSVNLITVTANHLSIRHLIYFGEQQEFQLNSEHLFPRATQVS